MWDLYVPGLGRQVSTSEYKHLVIKNEVGYSESREPPCHQRCVSKGRNGIEEIPASNRELRSLKAPSALSFDSDAKASTEHTTYFLFFTLSDSPRCLECYSQHFPPQRTTSVSCTNSFLPLVPSMGKWY